ncbi:sodium/potassium-transporting ATPase subunit beta-2-like isoform X2 [Zootermopsis nevadensis]|uniref:sodium/potassium-transporting ATPase subunit beta-2-like isoform X2 n=1 Tax=Zootermopsis nevadensis TaxID=136037 RepID=UPI000B8E39EA|nr:sodium/potassium-transporting ATPase subunit beta-2-like isoform X2 [Zootermopsis nevadensis]
MQTSDTSQCEANMEKGNKFVDPMEALFTPPPHKTKIEALTSFFYDSDEGSCLGRTPSQWLRVFLFYLVFYIWLAAFWAACMWGLLQTIDTDTPTYVLDSSIIGTSPGLASRPMPPEGRESILTYAKVNKSWVTPNNWIPTVDKLLEEYQTTLNNTQKCSYRNSKEDDNSVCDVDINSWGDCKPNGSFVSNICMYFKINKVFEWKPDYYKELESLPKDMPDDLKNVINNTFLSYPEKKNKVWLSCEGRHEADQEHLGPVRYFPEQGFPGYFYPFRNQIGFRSPIVAMRILEPKTDVVINLECRAWARNIEHDRKEQLGMLNYKIKIA